jgi:hypothetical protein
MNYLKMLTKSVLGLFTGLAAVIILGIVQSISSYQPIICTAEITTECSPQLVASAYYAIIPVVSGLLVGAANWLKHKNDPVA